MLVVETSVGIGVKSLVAGLAAFLLVLPAWLLTVNACIDPSNQFAIEVVLNKPGVDYNYTALENLVDQNKILKTNDSVYVFKYRYEFLDEFAQIHVVFDFIVVLYKAKFSSGAPYIEGISDPNKVEYYPAFRLELTSPPRLPEGELELHIEYAVTHFLVFLRNSIVVGLSFEDVFSIARRARLGYAGWNGRLVYCEDLGDWAPYGELVSKGLIQGLLVRGNECAMQIPENTINAGLGLEPLYTVSGVVVTTASNTVSEQAQAVPILDGILVAVALVAGVVAGLIAYLYISRKY